MGKFRLNAPQTESDFDMEGSMPFGGIGDQVENPSNSTEFNLHGSNDKVTTSGGSSNRKFNGLVSLAGSSSVPNNNDGRVGIGRGEDITGSKSGGATETKEQAEAPKGDAPPARRSMRMLIIIGVVSVLLLVGLIVAVSVALTRDDGDATTDSSNSGTGTETGSGSGTGGGESQPEGSNPDEVPSSDTTLGRIYNEGILRCGVPVDQPGFAFTNPETGRMEGFDADLCRAVAAGIFGPDNVDDRVEYVPVSGFDRWNSLNGGDFDVLARTTTHTMEREVLEVRVWHNLYDWYLRFFSCFF